MTGRFSKVRVVFAALALSTIAAVHFVPEAFGQMSGSRPVGIQNETERKLFSRLRCMCGGCAREALSTCVCDYAGDRRDQLRAMLASGKTHEEILAWYVQKFGTDSLDAPPNEGSHRLIYLAPLLAIAGGAAFVVMKLRKFRAAADKEPSGDKKPPVAPTGPDEYDKKLDEELKRLDDDE